MEVLLDTNFIISCVKKRIDFFSSLEELGFKVIVPREVFQEMKDLKATGKISKEEKTAIEVALMLLDDKKVNKKRVGGKYVDEGLIAKGKEGVFIATLDKEILREIPNAIVIRSASKDLEIVRK